MAQEARQINLTGINSLQLLAGQEMHLTRRPRTCQGVKMSGNALPVADTRIRHSPSHVGKTLQSVVGNDVHIMATSQGLEGGALF